MGKVVDKNVEASILELENNIKNYEKIVLELNNNIRNVKMALERCKKEAGIITPERYREIRTIEKICRSHNRRKLKRDIDVR